MSSLKTMWFGCLLAGSCGLALAAPAVAVGKGPVEFAPKPAEVCSAMSVSKHYTLADADFGWVRDQLNATLAQVPADPSGNFRKAAAHRIAADATQFGLRLDHARCDAVQGPLAGEVLRAGAGISAKDCREAGCEDPLPGWTAQPPDPHLPRPIPPSRMAPPRPAAPASGWHRPATAGDRPG